MPTYGRASSTYCHGSGLSRSAAPSPAVSSRWAGKDAVCVHRASGTSRQPASGSPAPGPDAVRAYSRRAV
ncbi:hypothetical protein SFUMM280S_01394 [Streptomyces fumanus]